MLAACKHGAGTMEIEDYGGCCAAILELDGIFPLRRIVARRIVPAKAAVVYQALSNVGKARRLANDAIGDYLVGGAADCKSSPGRATV